MSLMHPSLLIGEILVDFTITPLGRQNKMRLGGLAHAGRALWALGRKFDAAVFLPQYLENITREYFASLGCVNFIVLGYVEGAPNLILIMDPTETGAQGYDTPLHAEKSIQFQDSVGPSDFSQYLEVLIFPGKYSLEKVSNLLPENCEIFIDVAYDVESVNALKVFGERLKVLFISTSSELFKKMAVSGIQELAKIFYELGLEAIVLKENRGGSRLYLYFDDSTAVIPAQLGVTVNSVGVGDAFAAAYLHYMSAGHIDACWRATWVASAYAQTTCPDYFQKTVIQDTKLSSTELKNLGGTSLPWENRRTYQIYLAAPDFSYRDRIEINKSVDALEYHNFRVRRPIQENGELAMGSNIQALNETYRKDLAILKDCDLVFAIPQYKDPGTLIEAGIAIEMGKPVITYDPFAECNNPMVISGSTCYSQDLETCINATFIALSNIRGKKNG